MEKKTISNFQEFECSVTNLDKIKGGKEVDEKVHSGDGAGMGGKTVREWLVIYDDDSFSHEFAYTE